MRLTRAAWLLAFLLLALLPAANAQSVVGQISGTVVDMSGAAVPGASVELTHDVTHQVRTFVTEQNGAFIFPGLLPGEYSVRVSRTGFKTYTQRAIAISAQENVDLHQIQLDVGDVSTSIEVAAAAARVQTDSADRISTLSESMVADIPSANRSFLAAVRTIPGSQSTNSSGGGSINGGQTGQLVLQLDGIIQQDSGAPSSSANVGRFNVNLDAVNEIQVQVNAMNAEFGSRAGGQVLVTTKSGTNQFHGTLYEYLRNDDLDASTFFNNKTGVVRPNYKFNNPGGTIGGPVLLPWLQFNRNRNRMFFFYSEDHLINHNANTNTYTLPTAAEINGDFSRTVDGSAKLVVVKDPTTGAPFPNNVIPVSRMSPEGLAMMHLMPSVGPITTAFGTYQPTAGAGGVVAPYVPDPLLGYNTQSTFPVNNPATTRTLRLDFNLGASTTAYVRLLQSLQNSIGVGSGQTLTGTTWGQYANTNPQPARGYVVSLVHTFRPNLIADFTAGSNYVHQQNKPNDQSAFNANSLLSTFKDASGNLVNPIQIFGGNSQNLIPNIEFCTPGATGCLAGGSNKPQQSGLPVTGRAAVGGAGAQPGAVPAFGFDNRWPFDGTDLQSNYAGNVTWVKGSHTFKGGFNWENGARNVSVYSVYNTQGTYFFDTDTGNPLDTGYPFSNLLLGSIQSYGQDNVKQINHARWNQYEWYVQDTWKATRRLTLTYGIRFQLIPQITSQGATLGLFNAASYNASKTGQLLFPGCKIPVLVGGSCSVANTIAVNPVTGTQYAGSQIGLFDPKSFTGSPYSGIDLYPNGSFFKTHHPEYGPRVGFAYDVFGDGKMALRGAFGIFYQRAYSVDTVASNSSGVGPLKVAPVFQSPTYFDTTFAQLASATAFYGPQSFNGGSPNIPNPTTYSWSFGVQRDIGKGMVLDVSYIGNAAHHQQGLNYNANPIPPDTVWSPTQSGVNSAGLPLGTVNPRFVNPDNPNQILPINLVRALIGYNGLADITSFTSTGESYYDALQVQINKRFGNRLTFSSNWTWQKTITYTPNQFIPDALTKNVLNRKQAVNVNLDYAIPSVARFIGKNPLTSQIFEGWHVDSVMSFFSGDPLGITCTVTSAPPGYPNGQDGMTGAIPLRCDEKGTLFLSPGTAPKAGGYPAATDPRLWYPINISSFTLPALATNGLGSAPLTSFWGPGFENVDLSVYKSFQIVKESNQLTLRVDMLNAFNHFNPSDPNTTLQYNYSTGAQANAQFGQITAGAGAPATGQQRVVVVSLRFHF